MLLECEACSYSAHIDDLADLAGECPTCGATLVLVPEEVPTGPLLQGVGSDLPPLPSWDGSDTREVRTLADSPLPEFDHDPVEMDTSPLDPTADSVEGLVETVDVGRRGTAGSGSRTFDSHDLADRLRSADPETRDWKQRSTVDLPTQRNSAVVVPDESTRNWISDARPKGPETRSWEALTKPDPPSPPSEERDKDFHSASEPDTHAWEERLLPVDADWEALIEESLPERETEDPDAVRRIVRLPLGTGPRDIDEIDPSLLDDILKPYGLRMPNTGTSPIRPTEPERKGSFAISSEPPPPMRVIDSIPRDQIDPALVVARNVETPSSERYREVLLHLGASPRTVLITSATSREGRTTVAVNLALSAALRPNRRAILVEADLDGRSVLAAFNQPPTDVGLLTTLRLRDDPRASFIQFGRMDLVPRGHGPGRDLIVDHLGDYLATLRRIYPEALIVVDGPPVSGGAAALVPSVDDVLLVIRRGKVPRDAVAAAAAALGPGRLGGAVFNEG